MTEEEKKAIEYLKTRLYGNKGCKYIDVAQEDLRIFIKLVDRLQKENEELKYKYNKALQKVKDKIEEIGEQIEYEENEKVVIYLHKQKNILQELLESEE